jgi:hypothetical protein
VTIGLATNRVSSFSLPPLYYSAIEISSFRFLTSFAGRRGSGSSLNPLLLHHITACLSVPGLAIGCMYYVMFSERMFTSISFARFSVARFLGFVGAFC